MNDMSSGGEESALLTVIDREVAAAAKSDFQEYSAVLAEDAVFMPPNGPPRSGTELRSWLRQFLEGFAVEWVSFQHGDVAVDGLHGYHSYEYEWRVTTRAGGEASVSCGKGLHVLRREADGSWKIVREIWNASPVKNC
jgi:ketosteroid isomerase-like protein